MTDTPWLPSHHNSSHLRAEAFYFQVNTEAVSLLEIWEMEIIQTWSYHDWTKEKLLWVCFPFDPKVWDDFHVVLSTFLAALFECSQGWLGFELAISWLQRSVKGIVRRVAISHTSLGWRFDVLKQPATMGGFRNYAQENRLQTCREWQKMTKCCQSHNLSPNFFHHHHSNSYSSVNESFCSLVYCYMDSYLIKNLREEVSPH